MKLFGYLANVYLNRYIIVTGGIDRKDNKKVLDSIYVFDIKKETWQLLNIKIPIAYCSSINNIYCHNNNTIHILGGENENYEYLNSHYSFKLLYIGLYDISIINSILNYWIIKNNINIGWIQEFNNIIFDYCHNQMITE